MLLLCVESGCRKQERSAIRNFVVISDSHQLLIEVLRELTDNLQDIVKLRFRDSRRRGNLPNVGLMRFALLPFKLYHSSLPVSNLIRRTFLYSAVSAVSVQEQHEALQAIDKRTDVAEIRENRQADNGGRSASFTATSRVELLPSVDIKSPKLLSILRLPKVPSSEFDAFFKQLCQSSGPPEIPLLIWKQWPVCFSVDSFNTLLEFCILHRLPVAHSVVYSALMRILEGNTSRLLENHLFNYLAIPFSDLEGLLFRLSQVRQVPRQLLGKITHNEIDLLLESSPQAGLTHARKLFERYIKVSTPLAAHFAMSEVARCIGLLSASPAIQTEMRGILYTYSKTLSTAVQEGNLSPTEIATLQIQRIQQALSDQFALALVKAPQTTTSDNHVDMQQSAYAASDYYCFSILKDPLSHAISTEQLFTLLQATIAAGHRTETSYRLIETLLRTSPLPHTTFESSINSISRSLLRRKQATRILILLDLYKAPLSARLQGRKLQALLALDRKEAIQIYLATLTEVPVQVVIALIHSFRGDEKNLERLKELWKGKVEGKEWIQNAFSEAMLFQMEKDPASVLRNGSEVFENLVEDGLELNEIHRRVRLAGMASRPMDAILLATSLPPSTNPQDEIKIFSIILRIISICLANGLTNLAIRFLLHPKFPTIYLTPRVVKRTLVSAARHHPFSYQLLEACFVLLKNLDKPDELFGRTATLHHTLRACLHATIDSEEEKADVIMERIKLLLEVLGEDQRMLIRIRQSLEKLLKESRELDDRDKRIVRSRLGERLGNLKQSDSPG